ncbi:MAG TPA: hypothetical protein VH593_03710, partial [Ktedonobacteraceae bacterium]
KELDDTTILAGMASDIGSTRKQLQELYDELQALEPDEQLQYLIKVMEMAHIEVENGQFFLQQEVQRFKFRVQAIRDYKPQPYYGQITLFRSTLLDSLEHLKEVDDQPLDLGWNNLATRPIDLHVINNVYHNRLMREPHVQALAEQLRLCFDKAQATLAVSRF